MKFQLETAPGRNVFTGYGEGYVAINRERHECGLIVGGDRLLFDWPARWEDLNAGHLKSGFQASHCPSKLLLLTQKNALHV